jgi:hypothetical protein
MVPVPTTDMLPFYGTRTLADSLKTSIFVAVAPIPEEEYLWQYCLAKSLRN